MVNTPFYDFDEAHRAESAKRMKEYRSFLTPLTGSVLDRNPKFKIPFKDNPIFNLYQHIERPPIVYWLMIISASLFGSFEWAYRLPSFLLGMGTILAFLLFTSKLDRTYNPGLEAQMFIGLLVLVSSSDLWLSSQYAQLDTGISLFLFISLLCLIFYCGGRKIRYLVTSGVTWALAILSKGQPAIILIFPIIYLILIKRLKIADFIKLLGFCGIILVPWVAALSIKFGLWDTISTFVGFALYEAKDDIVHHKAPFFWYARWWWDSFRPGWSMFLALVSFDLVSKKLSWTKSTLLVYIFGSLLLFSLSANKLWWYVLPLVPAMAFYIYLSARDYLAKGNLVNLSLIIIVASLPNFIGPSNKLTMLYGFLVTVLSFGLASHLKCGNTKLKNVLFVLAICVSLFLFYLRFPQIAPFHWATKDVALFYKGLPGKKCLWVYDMPPEATLFYSDAGEVDLLTANSVLYAECDHYLMSPIEISDKKLIYQQDNIKLYAIEK